MSKIFSNGNLGTKISKMKHNEKFKLNLNADHVNCSEYFLPYIKSNADISSNRYVAQFSNNLIWR